MSSILKEDLESIYNSNLDWNQFKDSTILITGVTGMIGSYFLYFFNYLNEIRPDLNIKIVGLCRSFKKMRKIINKIDTLDYFSYIICNVEDIPDIEVDYIIHTASPASSQFYNSNPVDVIIPNVIGTKKLLDLAVKNNAKVLFLSSGEVTGKTDFEYIDETTGSYLDPTDIRSCYGESKRMGENLCSCYSHQYEIHTISVRLDHTYGLTMDLKNDNRVFSEFISNIVNNENIVIKSDGLAVRTFTYISDAVKGMFIALLKGNSGETYNISNNYCRISIKDLAEILCKLYPEKKLKVEYIKRDTNNYLENKNTICSTLHTGKIEELGYQPSINIEEGFRRTIKFFEGH